MYWISSLKLNLRRPPVLPRKDEGAAADEVVGLKPDLPREQEEVEQSSWQRTY